MPGYAEMAEAVTETEKREHMALQLTIAAAALMPPAANMDQAVAAAFELFAKISNKLGLS